MFPEFDKYLNEFLERWRFLHKYWLSNNRTDVTVVLYQDLVDDISRFIPMAKFLGYDCEGTCQK